uniref:SPOC domain-containing protein n=1 Tax=Anopheles maculatus TaxID=74869 RepID=A0A182T4Q2_9DIPT
MAQFNSTPSAVGADSLNSGNVLLMGLSAGGISQQTSNATSVPSLLSEDSKKSTCDDHHSSSYNKKKHSSGKKDKRRDRSKEDHDKSTSSSSSRSKKSKNRHKEGGSGVIGNSGVASNVGGNGSGSVNSKFLDMELFGPISDEESQHSSVETEASHGKQGSVEPEEPKEEDVQNQNTNPKDGAVVAADEGPQTLMSEFSNKITENQQSSSIGKPELTSNSMLLNATSADPFPDKESRKRSKEKKRRDREKLRVSMAMLKDDENSVDLDEAGRALEAQLMSDNDQKVEDVSPASTIASVSLSGKRSSVDVLDVFRYTDGDGDDSMETSFGEKKDQPSASSTEHNRKDKKKKKKRGKEEKHKHHHNSGSSLGSGINTSGNNTMGNNIAHSTGSTLAPITDGSSAACHSNFGSNNNGNQVNSHSKPQPSTTTPVTPSINKLSLDIISAQQDDLKHNFSKPSPSLPCLLDESPPPSNKQQLTAQMNACESTGTGSSDERITPSSPLPVLTDAKREMICSTPTYEMEKTSIVQKSQDTPDDKSSSFVGGIKQKIEQTEKTQQIPVPPFGYDLDEQLHEKAVMSISGEFTDKLSKSDKGTPVDGKEVELKQHVHEKQKSDDAKLQLIEEKSRVVISQEETEDAVAALLGESFGTSNTPDFSDMYSDPVEEEQLSSQLHVEDEPPQIPEEDDEEMKKAIMSLNAEELDMKEADTPQSEHDLQIDTDTEDANLEDDHHSSLLRFDNPPKTPDVDLSQIGKPLIEGSQLNKVSESSTTTAAAITESNSAGSSTTKKDDSSGKLEMPATPGKNVAMAGDSPSQASSDETIPQSAKLSGRPPKPVSVPMLESSKVSSTSKGSAIVVSDGVLSVNVQNQKIIIPTTTSTIAKERERSTVSAVSNIVDVKSKTISVDPSSTTTSTTTATVSVASSSHQSAIKLNTSSPTTTQSPRSISAGLSSQQPASPVTGLSSVANLRHQYVVQTPPTITIPEQQPVIYHPVPTNADATPRGPTTTTLNSGSSSVQSPKQLHIAPHSPFARTSSPTALRQSANSGNRQSPQLSPIMQSGSSPQAMIIHHGGHIVVHSPNASQVSGSSIAQGGFLSQKSVTPVTAPGAGHQYHHLSQHHSSPGPRTPLAGGQLKTVAITGGSTKPNEQHSIKAQFSSGGSPGAMQRIITATAAPGSPSGMCTMGLDSTPTKSNIVVNATSISSTTSILASHTTGKAIDTSPKTTPTVVVASSTLGGTPSKTTTAATHQPVNITSVTHAQQTRLHPAMTVAAAKVTTQAQSTTAYQTSFGEQNMAASSTLLAKGKPSDIKTSSIYGAANNAISTITSNPNHQPITPITSEPVPKSLFTSDELLKGSAASEAVSAEVKSESERKQDEKKVDDIKAKQMPILDDSKPPSSSRLATTVNVDDQETDSKEDSDCWSAKEINIDSVIKKVDALCSEDDSSSSQPIAAVAAVSNTSAIDKAASTIEMVAKGGGEDITIKTSSIQQEQSKADSVNKFPKSSSSGEGEAAGEHNKMLETLPIKSVVPTEDQRSAAAASGSFAPPIIDDEEGDDTATGEASEKENVVRGSTGKRGGRPRGGRKTSESGHSSVVGGEKVGSIGTEQTVLETGIQTRTRGGKTPGGKRGRGGRGGGARGGGTAGMVNVSQSVTTPLTSTTLTPAAPRPPVGVSKAAMHMGGSSDVYEFHDDSGEDVSNSDKMVAGAGPDGARPRLILTIKNQAAITTATSAAVTSSAPTTVIATTTAITTSSSSPIATPSVATVVNTSVATSSETSVPTITTTMAQQQTTMASNASLISQTPQQQQLPTPHLQPPPQPQQQLQTSQPPQPLQGSDEPHGLSNTMDIGKDEQAMAVNAVGILSAAAVAAAANTRKSRRLLEKDGRSTIDDVIEDVVRNGPSPKVAGAGSGLQQQQLAPHQSGVVLASNAQQPQNMGPLGQQQQSTIVTVNQAVGLVQQQPQVILQQHIVGAAAIGDPLQQQQPGVHATRRTTRQNATTLNTTAGSADMRKSPRSTRKGKDRKISETSTDSSDEKPQQAVSSSMAGNTVAMKPQADSKALDDKQVAGTLSATTPVTPTMQASRPNETASVADKSKSEKLKSTDEAKAPTEIGNVSQSNSLTLIDPVTGEMAVVRHSKEGQYVPMPNAPQPLKKVIAAAAAAEQLKSAGNVSTVGSPSSPVSLSNSGSPTASNRIASIPCSVSSPTSSAGMLLTTNKTTTAVSSHQQQPTVATTKPHTLKSHVLNSQQALQQQQQQHQQQVVIKPGQQPPQSGVLTTQQQQSATFVQSGQMVAGKTIHPTTTSAPLKLTAQPITTTALGQPQQIIIHNAVAGQPQSHAMAKQSASIAGKSSTGATLQQPPGPPGGAGSNIQLHQHTGTGNLLINIPSNMHSATAVQMSPRLQQQQQQQMVISNAKQLQGQAPQHQQQHKLHVVQAAGPPGTAPQQIIIHRGKPGTEATGTVHQQQIPVGYTTVLQSGSKIIQQSASTVPGQQGSTAVGTGPIVTQVQQHILSKHPSTGQTIQIATTGGPPGLPVHYQTVQQPGQPTIVHKGAITTVQHKLVQQTSGQQQQQHKPVDGAPIGLHTIAGKTSILHQVPTAGGKIVQIQSAQSVPVQQQQQQAVNASGPVVTSGLGHQQQHPQLTSTLQPVGLSKLANHHISTPSPPAQQQQQQSQQPPTKGMSPLLHQTPQILTGAVASPPLKQSHLQGQQPIVAGASSTRVALPTISPQGQSGHPQMPQGTIQRHILASQGTIYEAANLRGDMAGFINRGQSPPPAHQQTSPITPVHGPDGGFRGGMPRDYVKYMYRSNISIPRSPLREVEADESVAASPPLELRRPSSGPRTTAVPLSLQSPGDRVTDSPQGAQVYMGSARIPHPYPDTLNARYYEPTIGGPNGGSGGPRAMSTEPPPAHRPHNLSTVAYAGAPYAVTPSPTPPPSASPATMLHMQRERDQQQQQQVAAAAAALVQTTTGGQRLVGERGTSQVQPGSGYYYRNEIEHEMSEQLHPVALGHGSSSAAAPLPAHTGGLLPAMATAQTVAIGGRSIQVATPPIIGGSSAGTSMSGSGASGNVPPMVSVVPTPPPVQKDSLDALLQRYPVMWQGLLALKNDHAAVQMHFVYGNPNVAGSSLPSNSDGSTPPLRIAQRMRLEPAQIDGVARKMQMVNEHCMLLALPCGRDRMDVLQQQNNLQTGFITYLQQKQAAGIVNIAAPGSAQAAYVVHIFPSCEFANENLARIAPDLMHRVANIQYLLIVIATV